MLSNTVREAIFTGFVAKTQLTFKADQRVENNARQEEILKTLLLIINKTSLLKKMTKLPRSIKLICHTIFQVMRTNPMRGVCVPLQTLFWQSVALVYHAPQSC